MPGQPGWRPGGRQCSTDIQHDHRRLHHRLPPLPPRRCPGGPPASRSPGGVGEPAGLVRVHRLRSRLDVLVGCGSNRLVQRKESGMSGSPERWLPVPDFEDDYEVSDHGRVRRSRGARGVVAGRFLRPASSRGGYPQVVLYCDGHGKRGPVHRLVAAAFIGPAPTPRHQVNHKNGIKSDNRLANLEWVTCQENNRHAVLTGLNTLIHPNPGERNGSARLTWVQVAEIRALRGQVGARQIAKRYGVSRSAIQFIHQDSNRHCHGKGNEGS